MSGASEARAAADCGYRDTATAHCMGVLSAEDSQRYMEHLELCESCRSELELAQADLARIDEALALESLADADAPSASASVRERLLERVGRSPQASAESVEHDARELEAGGLDRTWRRWSAALPAGASTEGFAAGMYAVTGAAGVWEPIGIPGIEVKRLAVDSARRTATMLVRMAAGTSYPPHRHAAVEECFVLSGDLRVGDRELRAGDFQISQTDSVHPVQSTREGCLLYISSSQDDELV